MRNFQDLNQEDLTYLKTQYTADIGELERNIAEKNAKLDKKIERNSNNSSYFQTIQNQIDGEQALLDAMVSNNMPEEHIENQKEKVDNLNASLEQEYNSSSNLKPIAVREEIKDIGIMERTIVLLQEYIDEIDTVLAA